METKSGYLKLFKGLLELWLVFNIIELISGFITSGSIPDMIFKSADSLMILTMSYFLYTIVKQSLSRSPFDKSIIKKLELFAWLCIGITCLNGLLNLSILIFNWSNAKDLILFVNKAQIWHTFNITTGFIILVVVEILKRANVFKTENELTI